MTICFSLQIDAPHQFNPCQRLRRPPVSTSSGPGESASNNDGNLLAQLGGNSVLAPLVFAIFFFPVRFCAQCRPRQLARAQWAALARGWSRVQMQEVTPQRVARRWGCQGKGLPLSMWLDEEVPRPLGATATSKQGDSPIVAFNGTKIETPRDSSLFARAENACGADGPGASVARRARKRYLVLHCSGQRKRER